MLATIERYLPTVQVYVARCPRCGMAHEFRVTSEGIELGYCYAAGSLHFAGMQVLPVAALTVGSEGSVWLDGRQVWPIGASR